MRNKKLIIQNTKDSSDAIGIVGIYTISIHQEGGHGNQSPSKYNGGGTSASQESGSKNFKFDISPTTSWLKNDIIKITRYFNA